MQVGRVRLTLASVVCFGLMVSAGWAEAEAPAPQPPGGSGVVVGSGLLRVAGLPAAGFLIDVVSGRGELVVSAPWPSGSAFRVAGTVDSARVTATGDVVSALCGLSASRAAPAAVPCTLSIGRGAAPALVLRLGTDRVAGTVVDGKLTSLPSLPSVPPSSADPLILSCPSLPYQVVPVPTAPYPPLPSAVPSGVPNVNGPGVTLRSQADRKGILIGAGLPADTFFETDPYNRYIPATQFNMIASTNQMYWSASEGVERNVYDYCDGDQFAGYAVQNHLTLVGEQLITGGPLQGSQNPNWVENGSLSASQLIQAMRDYIFTTVRHYGSKVPIWDVVNEAIQPNGQPSPGVLTSKIGYPRYVELAFQFAHEADPNIKLMYSDYWWPSWPAKTAAILALLKDLKSKGLTVNLAGVEEFGDGPPGVTSAQLSSLFSQFGALGVQGAITQLTVPLSASSPEEAELLENNPGQLAQQASTFSNALEGCLSVVNCHYFMMWGFSSAYSAPTYLLSQAAAGGAGGNTTQCCAAIYSSYYQPKPAYYALYNDLKSYVPPPPGPTATSTSLSATPTTASFGSPVSLAATVTQMPGAPSPTGQVTFYSGSPSGSHVTLGAVALDASGQATLATRALPGGSDDVYAVYSGDGANRSSTSSVAGVSIAFTSPCLAGTVGGNVTVGSGQAVCLSGAKVSGNLIVDPGGAVSVMSSTITGSLSASQANAVVVCATTVDNSASVSAAVGPVVFGDGGDDGPPGCAGDTVRSGLTISGNQAGVELAGDQLLGGVSVTGNSGAAPGSEDATPELEADSVRGGLSCSGNTPGLTDDGQPNAVTGARTGQCAGSF